jgi:ribosomal protein L14E/L6E/L27E
MKTLHVNKPPSRGAASRRRRRVAVSHRRANDDMPFNVRATRIEITAVEPRAPPTRSNAHRDEGKTDERSRPARASRREQRNVEIGRVALCNLKADARYGKLLVIVDIVDMNRVRASAARTRTGSRRRAMGMTLTRGQTLNSARRERDGGWMTDDDVRFREWS